MNLSFEITIHDNSLRKFKRSIGGHQLLIDGAPPLLNSKKINSKILTYENTSYF